jgi:diacylglycerol kinase (ATP)
VQTKRPFEFSSRARSFKYAGRGIWLTVKSQHNAWIHALATVAVAIAGYLLRISRIEWSIIALTCASVWAAEALNTAVEHLADATTKEFHADIGRAKDIAAGAVLITALAAVLVGLLVFGPHLLVLIRTSNWHLGS